MLANDSLLPFTDSCRGLYHALEIQEILLSIFGHCPSLPSWRRADTLALTRTCRAFKEPALGVLWEELDNLSPLVRCLPEASHEAFIEDEDLYDLFTPNKVRWL